MTDFPSLPEQSKNFTRLIADSIRRAIENDEIFSSDLEKKRRYDICQACEFFEAQSKRCEKCGCFMEYKVGITAAQCPVNKW